MKLVILALTALIVGAILVVEMQIGRADNQDFWRVMTWFTSGAADPTLRGELDPIEFERRFYGMYVSEWLFDTPLASEVYSSVVLLWAPGVALNLVAYSREVLWLPLVSILPRAILLGLAVALVSYVLRHPAPLRQIAFLTFAVPVGLLVLAPDRISFLNSFYQETASLIFLLLFLALVVARRRNTGDWRLAAGALVVLFLLAAAKASTFYWPWVGLPFILGVRAVRGAPLRYVATYVAVCAVMSVVALRLTTPGVPPDATTHNAFFFGVLTHAEEPHVHLRHAGMDGASECVGENAFTEVGQRCRALYSDELSRAHQLQVMLSEPSVVFRSLAYAADHMHDTSLSYLAQRGPTDVALQPLISALNVWSELKANLFPRGLALWSVIVLMAVTGAATARRGGLLGDMGAIALLCAAAAAVDMAVAVFGDGRMEIEKHLFLANLLFDVALVATLTTACLLALAFISRRLLSRSEAPIAPDVALTAHSAGAAEAAAGYRAL